MRVLIVKIGSIGDVIMATSMVTAVRARHPDASITWVVGSVSSPLLAAIPGIDEVITIDERALLRGGLVDRLRVLAGLWRRLAGRRFDLIALAHHDRRYGLLTLGTRAALRRSLRDSDRSFIRGRHHSHEYARLITGVDGPQAVRGDIPQLRPPLPSALAQRLATPAKLVLLAPGGARNVLRDNPMRRWPVEYYRDLACHLTAAGHRVALIGAGGDIWVREFFQGLDVVDLLGETSLPDLAAVMARADAVVTHDSMAGHMVRLVGAPAVVLFGPTNPMEFWPGSDTRTTHSDGSSTVLWGGDGLACRPCYDGREFAPCSENSPCMRMITVDAVLTAVNHLLARSSGPGATA